MFSTRFRALILSVLLLLAAALAGGNAPAKAQSPVLKLAGPAHPVPPNHDFSVDVVAEEALWLSQFEFVLHYDPALVDVTGFTAAEAMGDIRLDCAPAARRCAGALGPVGAVGARRMGVYSFGAGKGVSGTSRVGTIYLRSLSATGKTSLSLDEALVVDVFAHATIPATEGALLRIQPTHLLYLPTVRR